MRIIHIIKPNLAYTGEVGVFKMGRGHESEVRVNDISVSRCHSLIKFKQGSKFFLEDNLSKFGTLIIQKRDTVELEPNWTKAVQIGRSVISFTVKKMDDPVERIQASMSPQKRM
mmetsp:Transcript_25939/g.39756  ORF Transcript_25939/g.39756 Transcript_25939/m.39756 type:complete len:114 (-) Transcript_25939:24-365(-)